MKNYHEFIFAGTSQRAEARQSPKTRFTAGVVKTLIAHMTISVLPESKLPSPHLFNRKVYQVSTLSLLHQSGLLDQSKNQQDQHSG